MKKEFTGIWVSADIVSHRELNGNEKLLLSIIQSLEGDNGCYAGNEYFASILGLKKRSVQTIIAGLIEKGFISRIFIKKGDTAEIEKRVMKIISPPDEKLSISPVLNNTRGSASNNIPPMQNYSFPLYTDNKENTKINKKGESVSPVFIKPTFKEVSDYCQERNNGIDPQRFLDYYDSNGWRVGSSPMSDWRAVIRRWESNSKGEGNNAKNNRDSSAGVFKNLVLGTKL